MWLIASTPIPVTRTNPCTMDKPCIGGHGDSTGTADGEDGHSRVEGGERKTDAGDHGQASQEHRMSAGSAGMFTSPGMRERPPARTCQHCVLQIYKSLDLRKRPPMPRSHNCILQTFMLSVDLLNLSVLLGREHRTVSDTRGVQVPCENEYPAYI